jgi:hypothetical protein
MGKNLHGIPAPIAQSQASLSPTPERGNEMSKLTPEQKRKLDQTESTSPTTEVPIAPAALLAAARDRHDRELADLQTQVDGLADEFATRAAAIVEAGLAHSYQKARQRIGAIDLSFFDSGEAPETINALPPAVEV